MTTNADAAARTGSNAGFSPGAPILWDTDQQIDADMRAMRASGASWVRLDIDWASAEPARGTYNWTATDRVIDAAKRNGLEVLAIIAYSPSWARPAGTDSHAPPLQVADYERFARAAATKYRSSVAAWEIWNEPNLGNFWRPKADPVAYTRLLRAGSAAVRAGDPGARVLAGGLAPAVNGGANMAPADFLTAMYRSGARGMFDAVSMHPYSYPALPMDPSTSAWNTFYRLPLVRDVMVANGDGAKTVWITEFGAPTGTGQGAVSPELQARIIADGIAQARRWSWVARVFLYSLRDSGTNQGDREQNFGVLRADRSQKPAWNTVVQEFARPWGR